MGSFILSNLQMLKKIFHQLLLPVNSISFSPNGKKMFINELIKKFMSGQLQLLGIYPQRLLMKESFQSGSEINSSNYGEVTWNKDGTKLFYPR